MADVVDPILLPWQILKSQILTEESMNTYHNEELLVLAKLLVPQDITFAEEVQLSINNPVSYVSTFYDRLDSYGISEPIIFLPWVAFTDGLAARLLLSNIDWKEGADATIEQVIILSNQIKQGFLLEQEGFSEDMVSDELLKLLGNQLIENGLALISLDLDSDNYPLSVVTVDKVSSIQELVRKSGYGNVVWWKS